MTVIEVADYLKVHPSTIYRALKRGELPAFRVGTLTQGDWRVDREVLAEWVNTEGAKIRPE